MPTAVLGYRGVQLPLVRSFLTADLLHVTVHVGDLGVGAVLKAQQPLQLVFAACMDVCMYV